MAVGAQAGTDEDPLYLQGNCKHCGIPIFGKEHADKDCCGDKECEDEDNGNTSV